MFLVFPFRFYHDPIEKSEAEYFRLSRDRLIESIALGGSGLFFPTI
jgi:hypothetical protein